MKGVEWKKDEETSKFLCLFEGCAKGPFTNWNHLAQHLQWDHMKTLPTLQLDRKPNPTSKKRNINSWCMNARVLTKPFNRQRKEFWKKIRAWKAKGEDLWKAIEDKAQGLDVPKEKLTLIFMIGIQRMASFLGVKKCGEDMVNAIKVNGLPQNPNFAKIITKCKSKYAQDDKGKDIKHLFNEEKDWKKNLKKRARVV